METETQNQYEKAMVLAEEGQFQEAYNMVQVHLGDHPDDPEALNDAAVLLHCMHRSDEGLTYLQRARAIAGDSPEIVWNSAEAFLAVGEPEEALALLKIMGENGTINIDILNRTAHQLIDEDMLPQAVDLLNWSLDLFPDQELLKPMVQIIESRLNHVGDENPTSVATPVTPEIPTS